jgi:3-phosphoshikimate 1-carboxyvinyltransferase
MVRIYERREEAACSHPQSQIRIGDPVSETSIPTQALAGKVNIPGDKSLSHRTALFAALAQGVSRIENFQVSAVTEVMLKALELMGIPHTLDGNILEVCGKGINGWQDPGTTVYCGNSATTMRLLTGAMALCGVRGTLDGTPQLRKRPMDRIVIPMQKMGVPIQSEMGFAPIQLERSEFPLKATQHTLQVASAQVKSCLLLAGLAANEPLTLIEPGPSRDHTERLLRHQGITVRSEILNHNGTRSYQTKLVPPQRLALSPLHLRLPGDFSSAAFLIVAALIVPGSNITLQNVGLNSTRTGLLDALLAMGADIHILDPRTQGGEPVADLNIRYSQLKGISINGDLVVRMIDEFPIFSVAASYARGKTIVSESIELRHKESDRIASLCSELQKLGVRVTEKQDGFEIIGYGSIPKGGITHSHGDHRLAMALLTAGLAAPSPVTVENGSVYAESFPEFTAILNRLGANITKGLD